MPIGGSGDLRAIVGALLAHGLIVAVLMLVVSASTWANASRCRRCSYGRVLVAIDVVSHLVGVSVQREELLVME